jgi:Zn-dependent protease/CBS domain-containing protein
MFGTGGRRFKVATVAGIPIYVGTSLLLLGTLFVLADSQGYQQIGIANPVGWALASVFLFYAAILLHESAHAVVARRLGLPVWGVTLVGFGGYTQTKSDARGPGGQFLISFAGPGTTLVVGLVLLAAGQAMTGPWHSVLNDLGVLQLYFGVLNSLPGLPLDGAKMLMAAIWKATGDRQKAERVLGPSSIGVGSLLIGAALLDLSRGGGWGIFLALFGMMMIASGRAVPQRLAVRGLLARGRVADAMRFPPPTIDASEPVGRALELAFQSSGGRIVPVRSNGLVIGAVSEGAVQRASSSDARRPVRDVVTPIGSMPTLSPEETLDQALDWVSEGEGLVLDGTGSVVGVLAQNDIQRWANAQQSAATAGVPPRPDL